MGDDRRMYDNGEDFDFISKGRSPPSRFSSSPPPSDSSAVAVGVNGGVKYILHTVTKFDTLAGVAIKYGVEVADIKRLNGLVSDLQMFALKTLQIPLPGRHPPSPSLCNSNDTPSRSSSSEQNPSIRRHSDLFDSFQSLKLKSSKPQISPAMSNLQGYYGLSHSDQKPPRGEGFEMSVYRKGGSHYLEDGPFSTSSPPVPSRPLSHQRKSKSVANVLMTENGGLHNPLLTQEEPDTNSKWIEKLLRRRQKSEADFTSRTPEKLLKEESNSGSAISAITGKGLALRPKSASRTVSGGVDGEGPIPISLGDSLVTDNNDSGVRKSSSTSSLQESENNGGLSSIWTTSWNLKPDFQALSTAAMPIFDNLPKPIGRRNKKALD